MRQAALGLGCWVVFAAGACGGADDAATPDAAADTATAPDGADAADDAAPDVAAPAPLCATAGADPTWTLAAIAEPGAFRAGYLDLTLVDETRPTDAHGLVPALPSRTIAARVHYPAEEGPLGPLTPALLAPLARDAGPFPVLVHSHGFSSNKDELGYAAEWLATRGWVVVLLEFPLTRLGTSGGPVFADVLNQPADVSFALDAVLAHAATDGDPLEGGLDADRIALSGVSLGGLTTLLATYHRDLHDARVKAAVDLAGPTGFFTDTFYTFVDRPVLLVYGDTDAIVDYAAHALPARARAPDGTRLMTLANASHTAFAAAAGLFEELDNPDSIGCTAIAGQIPDDDALLDGLVDPAVGIAAVELPAPCALDPLPRAMRPSRQHLVTRLALFAWLELQLGADATTRASACALLEALAAEPDVELE